MDIAGHFQRQLPEEHSNGTIETQAKPIDSEFVILDQNNYYFIIVSLWRILFLVFFLTTIGENQFESLLAELTSKCNLTRDGLIDLIRKKKATVGDGYLTDQGALFLVAGDLGVTIDYDSTDTATLSGLAVDQKFVTLMCRILSVGYPKTFTRKNDSSKGLLMRIVVYDNSTATTVSLWDRSVVSFLDSDIRPGDLIKISKGYTRSSIDGSVALNTGDQSMLQKVPEIRNQVIRTLAEKTIKVSRIPENEKSLAVLGIIKGEVKKSTFSRNDGSSSSLASFVIADPDDKNSLQRTVIWGNANPIFSSLKDSDSITLLNVKTKVTNFQNTISVEIHGDETTSILERWDETKSWLKDLVKDYGAREAAPQTSKSSSTNDPLPLIARILAIRNSDSDGKAFLLLMDSQKRKISLTVTGGALKDLEQLSQDNLILCRPDSFENETLRTTVTKEKAIVKLRSRRQDIPGSDSLIVTVENLQQNGVVSLELMCLTDSLSREIQTKDGLVRRTELTVADHTGEIRLYGWRNLSKILENYSAGDRIFLSGVEVQTHEGKKFLQLKNYSTVKKLES